jgi:lytic murein transglycosylase
MVGFGRKSLALFVGLAWLAACGSAGAVTCGGDFAGWLAGFEREAAAKGISRQTIEAGLIGITPDPRVIALDRRQHVFKQSFEQFSARVISPQRLKQGAAMLRRHRATLSRIEQQSGVPAAVVVAIWGLETDFGVNTGRHSALRALATLAHDCRRTDRFQLELLSALQIVERGDLRLEELRGAWAGELGQTQFLPSSYVKFAVDFDGNGRRDLINSVPDVLASTANYLNGHGWRRGEPWHEGTHNFTVLREWNKAEVYRKTIALFAERLASAG